MRAVGYLFLAVSLVMVCGGVSGWMLHAVTLVGIVLSMVGTWWRHRRE